MFLVIRRKMYTYVYWQLYFYLGWVSVIDEEWRLSIILRNILFVNYFFKLLEISDHGIFLAPTFMFVLTCFELVCLCWIWIQNFWNIQYFKLSETSYLVKVFNAFGSFWACFWVFVNIWVFWSKFIKVLGFWKILG